MHLGEVLHKRVLLQQSQGRVQHPLVVGQKVEVLMGWMVPLAVELLLVGWVTENNKKKYHIFTCIHFKLEIKYTM